MMNAEELVKNGQLDEALTALQQEIRNRPEDVRLRVFLFQMACVLGQWERALTQLQVVASLNAETMMLAQIFRPVINCEVLRAEIFAGKRTPLIFGEPMLWVGSLVQANELLARGEFKAARELRDGAFESAPATPGKINDQPFEWIADADSRLGPMLELILDGKYYWVPFCRIQKIEIAKPTDLRDLVWSPAQFVWTNGGQVSGHIPVRYPGTEKSSDGPLRLARKTEWIEKGDGAVVGLGQRLLATDAADVPLLECRTIELTNPPPGA
jgi:type VI secretion system protein ImpE